MTRRKSSPFGRVVRFSSVATALYLSACAPDLGPKPELQAPQDLASAQSLPPADGAWPTEKWWQAYGDLELDQLIDEALSGSPDLKIAEARLRQAQASSEQANAQLLPDLSLDASAQSTKQSRSQGFPKPFQSFLPHGWHTDTRVAANLDYELDLFGKNRAALAAATSDEKAAAVDVAEARLVLSTSIASAYADLVRLSADRASAEDAVHIRDESAKLVSQREAQGLENKGASAQALAEADAARADEDVIDGQIGTVRDQIAALLGKGPDRGLDVPLPQARNVAAPALPAQIGIDLVGRRPDLVAARLRAEAASDRIDVAHADFYPNIDLSGLVGFQSLDIGHIFMHGSLIGAIGPALHLPIFDGGRIAGAYRGARASYDEAVATYDKTLVDSLHEAADAMVGERELATELGHSRASLKQSEDAYRIAKERYQGGLSRYLDVLTAEDTLVLERRRVADLEARSFAQNVALVRALGGGFQSRV